MSGEGGVSRPPELSDIYFFGPGAADKTNPGPDVLGGKGYSLAEMSRAGLAVPPGFIIRTACCHAYYSNGKRWPEGLEQQVRTALGWLESVTGRQLGSAPKPLLVSVRSGAAVSMPGMMDTVLNVGLNPGIESCYPDREGFWLAYRDFICLYAETVSGVEAGILEGAEMRLGEGAGARARCEAILTAYRNASGRDFPTAPRDMLREAISAVFDSWESERAIKYRERNNVRGLLGTAVTVQAMFPSECSGVLFSADPNDPSARRIIIEASMGLGEAIVRGRVEPDVYIVDRDSLKVVEKRISDKDVAVRALSEGSPGRMIARDAECLDEERIVELARLGLKVEEYFGFPVDVEWGWADGRFGLLQSRKIRGLDVARDVEAARREEIERIRKLSEGRPGRAWAIHNLAETLPAPTPLTWDIIGRFMSGRGGFGQIYTSLGYTPSENVMRDGFLTLIAGRIYVDVERYAELFFADFPLEYELERKDSATGDPLEGPPTKFNFERAGGAFLFKLPLHIYRMVRAGRRMGKAAAKYLDEFEKEILPAFLAKVAAARAKDLRKMSESELLAELDEREKLLNDIGRDSGKATFIAAYYHGRLAAALQEILGPSEGMALTTRLLMGLEGDRTLEQNIALYRVARGELTLERFLEEYGHRAVGEFELAEPRWSEDPSYPKQIVENYRNSAGPSPIELHERQKRERKAAEESLGRVLAEHGASSLEGDIREDLAGAQRYMPYRETGKYYFMMAMALVRDVLKELGERWDLGRDIFFLHRDELAGFPSRQEELRKEISKRKVRWQALQRLPVPEIIRSDDPEAIGRVEEKAAAADGVMSGVGVAAGVESGTARIVRSPKEAGDLGAVIETAKALGDTLARTPTGPITLPDGSTLDRARAELLAAPMHRKTINI
ncbi:MAG: hypothetical protein N3A38_09015, partial [Planctomycetota bacterium]|nr:hypothetical protein [Planctomycetota bacterium]